jgi:small subunit ribosomal protein S20
LPEGKSEAIIAGFRISPIFGQARQEFQNMANSAQARKRARQAEKARQHNTSQRSAFRTAIKKVLKAVEAGDKAAAQTVFQLSVSIIDRIADKEIFHKNKAARHKSRLSAAIKAMA